MTKIIKSGSGWFSSRNVGPEFKYLLKDAQEVHARIAELVGKVVTCGTKNCEAELQLEENDRIYYENQSGCPYPADEYHHIEEWSIRCSNCFHFVKIKECVDFHITAYAA